MYGKFFASTFTGSMYGSGPDVFSIWAYALANTKDGTVELNAALLSGIIGMGVDRVEAAIAHLSSPDPRSRSSAEEGRRLVREGQFLYRVVNWAEYRKIRSEEERREYNRLKQREYRAKAKSVTENVHGVPPSMTVNDNVLRVPIQKQSTDTESEAYSSLHGGEPQKDLSERFPHPDHLSAYRALRRAQKVPLGWDAIVRSVHTPTTGGQAFEWPTIGAALLELHGTGGNPTANALRAFCRRLTQPDPATAPNGRGGRKGNVSAAMEALQEGLRKHGSAAHGIA